MYDGDDDDGGGDDDDDGDDDEKGFGISGRLIVIRTTFICESGLEGWFLHQLFEV